jgi:SAM-dependent methyltransferase
MSSDTVKNMRKLNLGCGNDIRSDYVNLDSKLLPGVNVVHDLENLPLPFENASFEFILCQDVLEHVEYIQLLKELHRILIPGGKVQIRVPHFTSVNNFRDPTHKKMFSVFLFNMFVKLTLHDRGYYFDFHFSESIERRITFRDNLFYMPVKRIANINDWFLNFYEYSFLSRIFPADNVLVTLVK